jgi:hypothetical protein
MDTAALMSVLNAVGVPQVDLTVCGPHVPLTLTATPAPDDGTPSCVILQGIRTGARVTVEMHPSAVGWWTNMGLLVVVFTGILAAVALLVGTPVTTRRRIVAGSLGGVALAACVVAFADLSAGAADNLGVLGQLSGTPLFVAGLAGLLFMPGVVGSIAVILMAFVRRGAVQSR